MSESAKGAEEQRSKGAEEPQMKRNPIRSHRELEVYQSPLHPCTPAPLLPCPPAPLLLACSLRFDNVNDKSL
jgi:hypothetical protein